MAIEYERVHFRKRAVQFPRSYTEANDQGGGITHTPHPGDVGDPGVLPNEENMNRMDKAIADCVDAINGLDDTTSTLQGNMVTANQNIGQNTQDIASINAFISRRDNPTEVTKAQVGLGNVPNVTTNNQTPTYSARGTDDALVSGETLAVAMSKLARAVDRLYEHVADMDNPHHLSAADIGAFAPVQGEYTGNGASERSFDLGFQPMIVIWCDETGTFADDIKGTCGGVIYRGRPQYVWGFGADDGVTRTDPYKVAEITDSGFKIYNDNRSSTHTRRQSNKAGIFYHYIAW